jgi:hypothetical protein
MRAASCHHLVDRLAPSALRSQADQGSFPLRIALDLRSAGSLRLDRVSECQLCVQICRFAGSQSFAQLLMIRWISSGPSDDNTMIFTREVLSSLSGFHVGRSCGRWRDRKVGESGN